MPKLVDNYVLTRRIGSGQFGEVFKGYDRTTNNDVAVKVIKRQNLKGKFVELLENQIKVLKGSPNSNIIKLYDMKKTSNNYYLMLEYCNEGDLQQYLRKKNTLTQDQAIEFLVQILHGFKTLVKNKILHRDFKLPNILLHDGQIKIADFGFAKLLQDQEYAKTVLGSPLNMAPEIILGLQYNNKADIYSIGVSFYQMMFGRPPFNSPNILELEKLIKKGEVQFPKYINKISPMAQELICRMLAYDPEKRIDWPELFEHPILKSKEEAMQDELSKTLSKDYNLLSDMSKFYLKQNMVILHPTEILKKELIVNLTIDIAKHKGKLVEGAKGDIFKRSGDQMQVVSTRLSKTRKLENQEMGESEGEILTKVIKANSRILLNERNKIIFILSIIKQLQQRLKIKNAKMLLWVIGSQLQAKTQQLTKVLTSRQNIFKLQCWDEYLQSNEFQTLSRYFSKQSQIISYEHSQLLELAQKTISPLVSLLRGYLSDMFQQIKTNRPFDEVNRLNWIHLDHLIDLVSVDEIMKCNQSEEFNFKLYYLENGKITMDELVDKVTRKAKL